MLTATQLRPAPDGASTEKTTSRPVRVATAPHRNPVTALLPIMAVVAIAFLIIGLALPVLPLHVHLGLWLNTFVVGAVTGGQFLASLFSRVGAGQYADRRGARRAMMLGLWVAVLSGTLYLVSFGFAAMPWISMSILLAGRVLLGVAESFIITGAATWGLAVAGPQNDGRVIAWGGHGDVRRDGPRCAAWHEPLRDRRLCRGRSRDRAPPPSDLPARSPAA